MSYPYPGGGGGYPPQGGYPGQPQPGGYQGYPAQGGAPPAGGAPYPQGGGMPQPYGGGAPVAGGLPYQPQPADIGFGGGPPNVAMPSPAGAAGPATYSTPMPGAGGYPQQGGGYPQQGGGYPQQGGGYPQQGGGYPQQGGGYPQQGGAGGYPAAGGSGYPQAGGAPSGGYPQGGGAPSGGYPQGGGAPSGGCPQAGGAPSGGYPQSQPAGQYPQGGTAPPPQGGAGIYPNVGAGGGQKPAKPAAPPTQAMAGLSLSAKRPKGQGTVKPYPGFDAETDCKVLRKAMKGLGTDEKAIIDVLCNRSNEQRIQIKVMFKTMYGKDLIKELKSELGGRFEDVILALMETPRDYDAICLKNAISGAGTDEACLIETLCTRTNAEIADIKAAYKRLYKRDLEKDLMSDTSGHFKRLMVALCSGGRNEAQAADHGKAQRDAQALYSAGEKRWGTDESQFNAILCSQSHEQLRLVFEEYRKLSNKTMEQAIKSEMSGDLEDGMLAIVRSVQNIHAFFAERLYKSMKGAGTKDNQLIRVVVTRCEIDMVQIKQEFQRNYGKSLESFITGDCSGDYKRALLALVN